MQGTLPLQAGFKADLYADMQGFGVHAAVRCDAHNREALEQLSCYVARPTLDGRAGAMQRRWPGGAEALATPRDVAAGVHAIAY